MADAGHPGAAGAVNPGVAVNPWELARTGGRWVGEVPAGRFTRLAQAVHALDGAARLNLGFALAAGGACRVAGTARLAARLVCGRCLDAVACELSARIDALVVVGEAAAAAAARDCDVCVLAGEETHIETLVEDDFLLGLPTHVCAATVPCPRAPALSLPPAAAAAAKPFGALAALVRGGGVRN